MGELMIEAVGMYCGWWFLLEGKESRKHEVAQEIVDEVCV